MKAFITKNKKAIIIGGILLLAVAVGAIIITKSRKKKMQAEAALKAEAEKGKNSAPAVTGIPGVVFPIKKRTGLDVGMPAEQTVVKNIQKYINQKMLAFELPIPVNGIYDTKTEAAALKKLGVATVSYSLYKEILSKLK